VGLLLPLAALVWLGFAPGPRTADEQFAAAGTILRARMAEIQERTRSAARVMAAAGLDADGAGFDRAQSIRRESGADGIALLDADWRTTVWAGRTFEFDKDWELADVRAVGTAEGVLPHPAHPVLYTAVYAPEADHVAIAFATFDERFPVRRDLGAAIAREAGLAAVDLAFGTVSVNEKSPLIRTAVIPSVVHATFRARTEEESLAVADAERDRRLRLLYVALVAWFGWIALGLCAGTRLAPVVALLLIGVARAMLLAYELPDHDPAQALLSGIAMLAAVAVVRATPLRPARFAGAALLAASALATLHWHTFVESIALRGLDRGLFDPTSALPGWDAALLLAAAAAATLALLLLFMTAVGLLARPIRVGPLEGAGLLALLTALVVLPVLHASYRVHVEDRMATRLRALVAPETERDAERRLASAIDAAIDVDHGADTFVAAKLRANKDVPRLGFELWAASDLDLRHSCAVEIYYIDLALASSFDLDAPGRPARPAGPRSIRRQTQELLPGRGTGADIRYRVQDVILRTDAEPVGIARFSMPDPWDLLRSSLRAPIFTEPFRELSTGGARPLVVAELDAAGAARFVSHGATSDLPRPGSAVVSRAHEDGSASIACEYEGRAARMLIVPGRGGFAAIVHATNSREQVLFEAAHLLFVLATAWIAWLALRWRHMPWAFRHTIALFLVLLSVFPVVVIAFFQQNRIESRYEQAINQELRDRLDLAETLLNKQDGKADQAWCVALSTDHRIDVNIYDGSELVATSRPGVWDTGLLSRQLAAPAYEQLVLAKQRQYLGREPFAGAGDLLAGYRRLADERILVVPELTDRRAVERGAAEETAPLFAFYVLAAALAVLLALPVAYLLLRPVRRLQAATREVAAGNLDVEFPPARGRGELGDLERSFASMTRDLRDAQELRVRTERLSAWREMAQQIAHDVKNPLTPMKLTVQNLLAIYDEDRELFEEEFGRGANVILEEIDRLQRIASNFSTYARVSHRQLEPVDLGALLAEVAKLHGAAGTIDVELHGDELTVHADRDELHRVLNNLITNARQAEAQRIVLEARRNGSDVTVRVIDDGRGIDIETMERIFEPRFTTRTSGAGLGLPIVQGIVNDMGGTIALESDPGQGTRVTMRLPI